jgi:hypothetical protein
LRAQRSSPQALDSHDQALIRIWTADQGVLLQPVVLGQLSLFSRQHRERRTQGIDAEVASGWNAKPAALGQLKVVSDRQAADGATLNPIYGYPDVVEIHGFRIIAGDFQPEVISYQHSALIRLNQQATTTNP